MSSPYIVVDGPQPTYVAQTHRLNSQLGYHAFFVCHIPFIPSFLSADFTRMIIGESSRIKLVISRQIRFLNDICSCKTEAMETFDLRFVSIPMPNQPFNQLQIFFIGKTFGEDEASARASAQELYRRFQSYFPSEDPFNYPLHTITAITRADGKVVPSNGRLLRLALQPIDLTKAPPIIEIRKYEDHDPMMFRSDDNAQPMIGYFPHPFRPTIDFSAMSRLLETFATQPQRCVASISLRPTALSLEEHQGIMRMMQHYHQLLRGAAEGDNWLALYRQERFDDLVRTFEPIINQRNHLFLVKIQVLGQDNPPLDVVAALGSEIMNNTTPEPRLWTELIPQNAEEIDISYTNFRLLEYRPWNLSTESLLWRLSSLVTSYEAVGAFRLPVPPESGHMAGLRVRDEPFVMPFELASTRIADDVSVELGKVIHRGTVTETSFSITLSQLKRHGLVAGSTGSGKTNTCLHLLTQLWRSNPAIPFLVVYPIDKPDYRLLLADPSVRENLLIFTMGDDTTYPLRFNPFYVPPGQLVRAHMSLLMRAFSAAFSMWDPLPAIYRTALRRVYEEAGFRDLRMAKGGDLNTSTPLLSRFYELLIEVSEEMTRDYGQEAKGNIRQGAEIRIRDLLQNAGHVLNVAEGAPWHVLLEHPTVLEMGRIGSTEDSALVMGFLLMSLTSHLASRRKQERDPRQHITLIEEAHRLMAASHGGGEFVADPRAKAGEDFANILAEVRGFNEGILIAEQIPTDLVSGAIGNTYVKIMHWLEEESSYQLFADIMNLNGQQREFARTLPTGQAIVRGSTGRPALVQVTNYLDQFQHEDDSATIDDSDEAIRQFMLEQSARLELTSPPVVPYMLQGKTDKSPVRNFTAAWMLAMPMQTCAFCEALQATGVCKYGATARRRFVEAPIRETLRMQLLEMLQQEELIPAQMEAIQVTMRERIKTLKPDEQAGLMYCYLAHEINTLIGFGADALDQQAQQRARALLTHFNTARQEHHE